MINFIIKNLINGKLTIDKVQKSKTYSPYFEDVKKALQDLGYEIKNNKLVKK